LTRILPAALVLALAASLVAVPVAAAPIRAPDLIVDWYQLANGPFVDELTFEPDSCVVQEGYAPPGTHRLLRFHTVVQNVGTADLMLGKPSADDPDWLFSPCHQHWHFVPFAEYRLLAADGTEVGIGHKQAFCLMDGNPIQTTRDKPRFTCERQGLSAGWEDAYFANLSGQWIVIDDVAPGTYTLSVEVNYAGVLPESDYGNNLATVSVTIS
jgi:hypothetical protein